MSAENLSETPSPGTHAPVILELKEQGAKYQAILDSAVDAIITINERGIIESFNPAAEKHFGYTAAEVVGSNVSRLMPAPYASEHDQYLANYLHSGVKRIIGIGREVQARRKDGTEFPVELAVSEVNLGKRKLFTGIVKDITDRKRTEEALRHEHEFAEAIIQSAQAIVLVLDTSGRIVRFNRYMEEISGHSIDAVRGKDWFETFLPEHYRAQTRNVFHQAVNSVEVRGNVNPIVCHGGSEREIAWWARAMHDVLGNVTGVLAVGHDVSELRDANRKLVQSERLAAVGEAMTRLAHESRNFLQRIQVAVETAQLVTEDNPELMQQLTSIENANDALNALLDEVRNYAAPITLTRSDANLADVLQEAWRSLAPQWTGRDVELRDESSGKLPTCRIDRFRMAQVFRNLLENSLAACADPVRIISCAEVLGEPNERIARICLRDNGPGLNEEQQHCVFEAFFTTKAKGTGLGMAIARRIVEAHGGRISSCGAEGKGAEFWMELPC